MTTAKSDVRRFKLLTATAVVSLLALSGCEQQTAMAPTGPAPSVEAPAPPTDIVVALQPETAVPATGVLSAADPAQALLAVTSDPVKGPPCNLEMIGGINTSEPKIELPAGSKMVVSGWMFSRPTHSVPVNRYLRVQTEDGSSAWETIVGGRKDRPDILPWFNIGAWALNSGFEQEVLLGQLPAGRYHLLMTYTENGKAYACDNGRLVTVTK